MIVTILFVGILLLVSVVLLIVWLATKKKIFGIILGFIWIGYFVLNSTIYGSFWKDFHSDEIIAADEDSRPGYLKVHWKSEENNSFNIKEITNYAFQNEWTIKDSIICSFDSLKIYLKSIDANIGNYVVDYSLIILKNNILNDLNSGENYRVYIFETNVLAVEPGDVNQTAKNGFVILNSGGTQLKIYHYWGEV